jgi:membrane-anchored protein YejM (alkaline phosphatase superfamily)
LYPPAALHNVEDPDALLAHRSAYAAQAAVVDACVGALWQAIEELAAGTETLLMLLGSRGFALGEHGNLGGECRELFGERLHLPWLVHECGQKIPRPRLAELAQPADVGATLWQWFGAGDREDASDGRGVLGGSGLRQFVVSVGDGEERAIRTPAWFLRRTSADAAPQLFAKPDDRWEANDVAVRCPQVVERLQVVLAEFEQCCRDGRPLPDGPLDDELINPAR